VRVFAIALIAAGAALACANTNQIQGTPSLAFSPTPLPNPPSSTGCEVRPAAAHGPVTDPNGPFFHQVALAIADGAVIRDPRQILDHASVPDGVRLPGGDIGIYYVNGTDGGVWFAHVNGEVATPVSPISLNGISNPPGVVDPDATAMLDGRIRLAYLSGFGPPGNGQPRAICLAESVDGVNFTVLGPAIRFEASTLATDPSQIQLSDGTWLMAISEGQRTLMARSPDGASFTTYDTVAYGGVPELALVDAGRIRLYVCARGIESYISVDAGRSWRFEASVAPPGTLGRRIVCDPSFVAGTDRFIFKTG
jgi:hypothetical protein